MKVSENEELTRVGADTPAGKMLRRYWHPIGLSADLTSTPKLVKIMGEELVLFRKPDGKLGLVGSHCAHRGASLAAGYVEKDGLRCAYHGWLFTVNGKCLEQPAEPPESKLKDRVEQLSYPVEELGGLIFTYMGPKPAPLLPRYDILVATNGTRRPTFARFIRSNWLQVVDNHQDPSHTGILHSQMTPWKKHPECHFFDSPHGSVAVAAREGASPGSHYIRLTHFITPNGLKVPIPDSHEVDFKAPSTWRYAWVVPVDDYTCMEWEVVFAPNDKDGRPTSIKFEADPTLYDMPVPTPFSEYIQPGTPGYPDYENGKANGPTVILRQDTLVQASQGVIQPRENEHLGMSDRGVIKLRRVIKNCIDAVSRGDDPQGVIRDPKENEYVEVEVAEALISEVEYARLLKAGRFADV